MRLLQHLAGFRVAAVAAVSLAVGCLGSSPNVSLYTMSPESGSSATGASDTLAIGVGPIRVPRYLDRPEWVTRPAGATSQLDVDDYRQWAGGFAANVLSVLGEDLAARLGTQRVVVYPTSAPFPLDYRVAVHFYAFEAVDGEALELRASWLIRAGSAGEGPWIGQSAIRRPIAGGSSDGLVAAHNEALGLLADAIAARIESLPRSDADSEDSAKQPPG